MGQFVESLFYKQLQKVVLGVYDSSLDGNMDILKQSMFEYYNLQKQVKILEHKKNN